MASVEATPMPKSDINALRAVVKERFKVLRSALGTRRHELEQIVRREILDEASALTARYNREADKLADAYKKLQEKGKDLEKRAEADGLDLSPSYANVIPEKDAHTKFIPSGLDSRVRQRIAEIQREHGIHEFSLDLQEAELHEELILNGLATGQAEQFLDKIPSLDKLLPATAATARKRIGA